MIAVVPTLIGGCVATVPAKGSKKAASASVTAAKVGVKTTKKVVDAAIPEGKNDADEGKPEKGPDPP